MSPIGRTVAALLSGVLLACTGLFPAEDSGDADAPASQAMEVSKTVIGFGEVPVGASASETVVLTNTADSPTNGEATVTGAGFSVDVTTFDVPATGEAGIILNFLPEEAGSFAGFLTLAAGRESIVVSLSGRGVDPIGDTAADTATVEEYGKLVVDQSSLAFGTLDLDMSSVKDITVSNQGAGPLTISSASCTDPTFTLGGNLTPPRTLDPGEERVVEVTFIPTSEQSYSANLELTSDDPNAATTRIALSGKGENQCDICSPLITVSTGGASDYAIDDFFSTSSLHNEDERTVTIGNDGDLDLNVSDVTLTNDYVSTGCTFTLGGSHGASSIAPGRTTTFTITFVATESCIEAPIRELDTNLVHILSNDPAEPDYVIELSGIGL